MTGCRGVGQAIHGRAMTVAGMVLAPATMVNELAVVGTLR